MPIYTQERTRVGALEEYTAPLGDVLGVTGEEALLYSPTSSIRRMIELQNAEAGEPVGVGLPEAGIVETRPTSDLISAEDARKRIQEEGVKLSVPDSGIRQGALDILIERKKAERKRQDVLARAPKGVGPMAAQFGTALAASMLDPLNVASAFIPVVGSARYASMLARATSTLGRAGVRARVGAIEGLAGAALVEPIVLGASTQEQADYGLTDTLLNLALGTALGGGLHVGAGAIGDVMARQRSRVSGVQLEPLPKILDEAPFETREAALRTAVAQAAEGRVVNVEPLLRDALDPNALFREPSVPKPASDFELGPFVRGRYSDYTGVRPADRKFLEGLVTELKETDSGFRLFREAEVGGAPEVTGFKATTPEWFQAWNRQATAQNRARRAAARRGKSQPEAMPIITRDEVERVVGKMLAQQPLGRREGVVAEIVFGAARELREQNVRGIIEERQKRARNVERQLDEFVAREEADLPSDAFGPETVRMADFDAARSADERLKITTDDETVAQESLSEIMAELAELEAAMLDPELVSRELASVDKLAETAKAYGKAVKAAANCVLRRGED